MADKVHVVMYTHKHGVDLSAFDSYEKAIAAAAELAYDAATAESSDRRGIATLHELRSAATAKPSTAAAEELYEAALDYLQDVGDSNVEVTVLPVL